MLKAWLFYFFFSYRNDMTIGSTAQEFVSRFGCSPTSYVSLDEHPTALKVHLE